MAEMTAATLRGLGLTLTNSDRETPVRCAVARFRARDGVLSAERIIIETDPVVITGAGTVHLDTEVLDLTLRGEPRKARLLRLRTPVVLGGSLRHPSMKLANGDAHATTEGGTCEPVALAVRARARSDSSSSKPGG
jgi:hypothetical protein